MAELDISACLFTSMHNTAYFSNFVYCSFGRPYGMVQYLHFTCLVPETVCGLHVLG